jgi:hypothetical protein
MTTYERELLTQCTAVVEALEAAAVPTSQPEGSQPPETFLALRPAMRALRMSCVDQRWIEAHIREEPETYHAACVQVDGPRILVVQLCPFLLTFACLGRHAVCTTFSVWHTHVVSALMRYGYYDPATDHTPPTAQHLTTLECREEGRDRMNAVMPGLGDMFAGQRPTTDEGRRNLWHLVIDDDGNQTMIPDCDLPDDEERDDEC